MLHTFVAVAKEGSLRKAAERLHMTPPTASGHIKALEENLQITLFGRDPKGMVLTSEGQILLVHAEKIISAARKLQVQASELRGNISGNILIGLNAPARLLKAAELAVVVKKNPNINILFEPSSTGKILDGLSSGNFDAGFVFAAPPARDMKAIYLGTFDLCIAVPSTFQHCAEFSNWEKLGLLPWVCSDGYCPFQNIAATLFENRGLTLKREVSTNDEMTKLDFVKQGLGAALLLKDECREAALNRELFIWDTGSIRTELFFAFLAERKHEPVFRVLRNAIHTVWSSYES